ncbi:hypothetical protein CEXT_763551 [Caerostris extrusa]|uniref:Secreted protein n=1 Tax=Caerostris extrusa TaxID=172846 RepID=A0AAV4UAX6_CAEEX|nr:hypothetical protein CEXT_763551 [Caerostris extrusa]
MPGFYFYKIILLASCFFVLVLLFCAVPKRKVEADEADFFFFFYSLRGGLCTQWKVWQWENVVIGIAFGRGRGFIFSPSLFHNVSHRFMTLCRQRFGKVMMYLFLLTS